MQQGENDGTHGHLMEASFRLSGSQCPIEGGEEGDEGEEADDNGGDLHVTLAM